MGLKIGGRDRRTKTEVKQGRPSMECVNAELIGSDTGRNDLTKVPSRSEDAGTYSEHHESVGV